MPDILIYGKIHTYELKYIYIFISTGLKAVKEGCTRTTFLTELTLVLTTEITAHTR